MIKRINLQIVFIIVLAFSALMFASIKYPPVISLWEGSGTYNDLKPSAQVPFLAIQTGGDAEGYHGFGYGLLMISKYLADIFGHSLHMVELLPIIYGLIAAFLLYIICIRWFNWRVATIATALLLSNMSFIHFQHSLRAQTLTLAALLFCIERLQKLLKNDNLFTLATMGLACALAAMHYMFGRLAMLAIIFFYLFDPSGYWETGDREGLKADFLARAKKLAKVFLIMVAILFVFFPLNILFLFNKTFIFSVLGEYVTDTASIFQVVWHNFFFMINFYVLGNLGGKPSDLMLDLPYPIEQKMILCLFIVGVFVALWAIKRIEMRFMLFMTSFLIAINMLSSIRLKEMEYALSSTMGPTRIFLLLPFIVVLAAIGTDYLYEKTKKLNERIGLVFVIMIIIILALRITSYFAEIKRFDGYMSGYKFDLNRPAISKDSSKLRLLHDFPVAEKRKLLLNQIYYYHLAHYIVNKVKASNQKGEFIKLIYVPADYYTPDYYRYGGGNIPWKGYPYYFPIYLRLYLGDQGLYATYLIKKEDTKKMIYARIFHEVKRLPLIGKLCQNLFESQVLIDDHYISNVSGIRRREFILATSPAELKACMKLKNAKVVIKMPVGK